MNCSRLQYILTLLFVSCLPWIGLHNVDLHIKAIIDQPELSCLNFRRSKCRPQLSIEVFGGFLNMFWIYAGALLKSSLHWCRGSEISSFSFFCWPVVDEVNPVSVDGNVIKPISVAYTTQIIEMTSFSEMQRCIFCVGGGGGSLEGEMRNKENEE